MNAYLFTAAATQRQVRSNPHTGLEQLYISDAALSAIVYGCDAAPAQNQFEAWCHLSPEGPHPLETEVKRIVGAQFIDQILTESGREPLDWPDISQRVTDMVIGSAVDDFEQGYWVDANQVVPPDSAGLGVEALKEALPEEVRSGVNWSPERKFIFLVSVLSVPPSPAELPDEFEPESETREPEEDGGEPGAEDAGDAFQDMRELDAAALVEARNSVIAAWLWRKYAANTPLASNDISVGQVCAIVPAPGN